MKITLEQLQKLDACKGGLEWYKKQGTENLATLVENSIADREFVTSEGENLNTLNVANWGLTAIMTDEQRREYGIYAASHVSHLWREKYPKEFKVWDEWASGRDRSNAARAAAWAAAGDAAGAARAAAWAAARDSARAAAWAARDSARAAAWAAAGDSAWAAAGAARDAAWAAAWAARAAARDEAYNLTLSKILRYGVKLLEAK